jgi:cell division protein ZapA
MANGNKKLYEVEIAGVPLKLLSPHPEYIVQNVIDYVDSKVSEAMTLTKNASIQNAALLAALNVAEELVLLKQNATERIDDLEGRTQSLLAQLESGEGNSLDN